MNGLERPVAMNHTVLRKRIETARTKLGQDHRSEVTQHIT